ncbi:MAG: 5'-nucleotidase C-terminal domain-containing protein [Ignavibacteriales bacterium]|nr:5'-nucleotidase C-terminal domain-containing protein [Ignavibacteriales bacterium]
MKCFVNILVKAIFCFALSAGDMFAQVDTLTFIHVNDTHSNLLPYAGGNLGGIARAATMIGDWKQTEPNPILVHTGDFMVGDLMFNTYFGVPELQILNTLGFDALCLGNHEFDAGPEMLAQILYQAQLDSSFEVISTNALNLDSVPMLKPFVQSHSIEQCGNVKVGLIGVTTPEANLISNPAPVFIDTNLVQDILLKVADLKTAGCQVVVLLSHLGFPLDMTIAQYLTGVDAIIGGHTHSTLETIVYVNNIPIVQAGEYYHYVGKLRLIYNGIQTSVLDYSLQEITNSTPGDTDITVLVENLKDGVTATYSPLIGDPYRTLFTADHLYYYVPISIDSLKTPMGELVTSAMLNYPFVITADFALEATGHMADNLYPGTVSPADLFRTYPYGYDPTDGLGFRIASFDLSGAEIYGALEALLGFIHPEINDYQYLMQSTGLEYSIDTTGGEIHLGYVRINGTPLQPESIYSIVSSDQVVGYLESLFGITPTNLAIHTVSVFQVMLNYIMTGVEENPISTASDFMLMQNYPNPFNPVTNISFTIANQSFVTLKVYNSLGQEMVTLVNEMKQPGSYTVRWDADKLPSGVYFYRLQVGSFIDTKKLILIR